MRFTTILIEADIEADVKGYEKYNEWCKFAQDGSCGDCIKRCPVNAITKDGHDKAKCQRFLDHLKEKIVNEGTLNSAYISGCGLCQTGVSCQDGIPGN
jgi:epoxyqueuosine reductase QueG